MGYKRITRELVQEAIDGRVDLWEHLVQLMDEYPSIWKRDGTNAREQFFRQLPRGLQLYWCLVEVDGEILNGGIRQLLGNLELWQLNECVSALTTLGARETASQVAAAIEIFQSSKLSESELREDYWSDPRLEEIDVARCNEESSKRDWSLMAEYVRRNPDQFVDDQ